MAGQAQQTEPAKSKRTCKIQTLMILKFQQQHAELGCASLTPHGAVTEVTTAANGDFHITKFPPQRRMIAKYSPSLVPYFGKGNLFHCVFSSLNFTAVLLSPLFGLFLGAPQAVPHTPRS